MTCSIHKYIMTIILAGAMILFMGAALQNVYAEGDEQVEFAPTPEELQGYSAVVDTMLTPADTVLHPGSEIEASLQLTKDGVPAELPEGAQVLWHVGSFETDDAEAIVQPFYGSDPTKVTYLMGELPEDIDMITFNISVQIIMDDIVEEVPVKYLICNGEMNGQFGMEKDFYDVHFPNIKPDMMVGDVDDEQFVQVNHYDAQGRITHLEDYSLRWITEDQDAFYNALYITTKTGEDNKTMLKVKRRSTVDPIDFKLVVEFEDATGDIQTREMDYILYGFTTDLSEGDIEIMEPEAGYFDVFEDNWIYVDDDAAAAAGAPKGVTIDDIDVINGDLRVELDSDDFTFNEENTSYVSDEFIVSAQKFKGFDSDDEYVFEPTTFPLEFDANGTSFYLVKVAASPQDNNIWYGETEEKDVNVYSKYSLNDFDDNLGASITYKLKIKFLNSEPWFRYEIAKGKTATPTVKIGRTTLKVGTDVKVTYYNKSTKKTYTSFPKVAGEYKVIFTGAGKYYGKYDGIQLKVGAKNPLTIKGKTLKIKAKGKKKKRMVKKTVSYKIGKVLTVKNAKGKVTYKKLSGNKKITVSKTGKVTVKKGLKKGTYKVKVSAKAAGNTQYFPSAVKKATFKIVVK